MLSPITSVAPAPYIEAMNDFLQSLLAEPRIENPPRRVWRDWFVTAAVLIGLVVEVALRDDINARPVAVLVVALMAIGLLWRRTYPAAVAGCVMGGIMLFDLVSILAGYGPLNLYSAAPLLLIVYATFRWGSGQDIKIVSALSVAIFIVSEATAWTGIGESISGFIVLVFPAALGVAVREQVKTRRQAQEQIRTNERESLARELHDTVAHHVSAIAIQAQAGRFVGESGSLDGAVDALAVIEEEASRTLTEMRAIVGSLRDDESPLEMAPLHSLADIGELASAETPIVDVSIAEGLTDVGPAVGAALYRITQESVTNARRHARKPTRIDVVVLPVGDDVQLTVTDDGDRPAPASTQGFGLIGMTERATLLGGTLDAGPAPQRGWQVRALLPREPQP